MNAASTAYIPAAALLGFALLGACGHTGEERAASGAATGAVAGAVIAGPPGALVGAGVGAVSGAVANEAEKSN